MKRYIEAALADGEVQKVLLKAMAWIALFFAPIKEVLFSVGFLIVADLITGVWAALKIGQKIESAKLRRSVSKSAAYLLAVCSGFVAQKYLMGDTVPVVHVVAGLIGATELLSVYENLSRITGLDFKQKVMQLIQPPKEENKSDEQK
jgi:phage-related holin